MRVWASSRGQFFHNLHPLVFSACSSRVGASSRVQCLPQLSPSRVQCILRACRGFLSYSVSPKTCTLSCSVLCCVRVGASPRVQCPPKCALCLCSVCFLCFFMRSTAEEHSSERPIPTYLEVRSLQRFHRGFWCFSWFRSLVSGCQCCEGETTTTFVMPPRLGFEPEPVQHYFERLSPLSYGHSFSFFLHARHTHPLICTCTKLLVNPTRAQKWWVRNKKYPVEYNAQKNRAPC